MTLMHIIHITALLSGLYRWSLILLSDPISSPIICWTKLGSSDYFDCFAMKTLKIPSYRLLRPVNNTVCVESDFNAVFRS